MKTCQSPKKRIYTRFPNETLQQLQDFYKSNKYPKREEIEFLAAKFSESFARVRNWFRSQRKNQFDKGTLLHDKKHLFSKADINQLKDMYKKTKYPSMISYREMATKLKSEPKNIKNWFEYQRKLEKRQETMKKCSETDNQTPSFLKQESTTNQQSMSNSSFMLYANPYSQISTMRNNLTRFMGFGYVLMPVFMYQPH